MPETSASESSSTKPKSAGFPQSSTAKSALSVPTIAALALAVIGIVLAIFGWFYPSTGQKFSDDQRAEAKGKICEAQAVVRQGTQFNTNLQNPVPGDLAGDLAVSTDTMVENVHFRRDWSSAADVGRKAVAACVADAEAMGAVPVGLVLSLAAPASTPAAWVEEFAGGVRAECERAGVRLVGGDTTSAPQVVVTATVLADLGGLPPLTRAGARPGQVLAMAGRLGWAAAGVAVLARGFRSPRAAVVAHRVPEVPYGEGRVAAEAGASALIDISDGLIADLGHVARASGVTLDVDTGHARGLPSFVSEAVGKVSQ